MTKPKVVCLCGSTRFYDEFQRANYRETMEGKIVLSVGFYPHNEDWQLNYQCHGEDVGISSAEKVALDELHKRKIDLADEVLILNVDGYIGDSTRSELEYARAANKLVRWLEPHNAVPPGCVMCSWLGDYVYKYCGECAPLASNVSQPARA